MVSFKFDTEYMYKGRTFRYLGRSGFCSFQAVDNGDIIILTDEECKDVKEGGQAIAKMTETGEIWHPAQVNVIQAPVAPVQLPATKQELKALPVDEKPEAVVPVRTTKKDAPLQGIEQPKK